MDINTIENRKIIYGLSLALFITVSILFAIGSFFNSIFIFLTISSIFPILLCWILLKQQNELIIYIKLNDKIALGLTQTEAIKLMVCLALTCINEYKTIKRELFYKMWEIEFIKKLGNNIPELKSNADITIKEIYDTCVKD